QGELSQLIDRQRWDDALTAASRLRDQFGAGNTFVELQHNLVLGDTQRVARLSELAGCLGLPVVASGNVHYHVRDRHRLQDAMAARGQGETVESSHRVRRPNSEFYLRTPEEMATVFARYPQAIANTAVVSDRCAGFNLVNHKDLGYEFPDFMKKADEQGKDA